MSGPYGSFEGGMGWGSWLAMAVVMLVFWSLVIVGIVLVARSGGHRHEVGNVSAGSPAAMRILDERLARGEIDGDEYRRRRQLLTST